MLGRLFSRTPVKPPIWNLLPEELLREVKIVVNEVKNIKTRNIPLVDLLKLEGRLLNKHGYADFYLQAGIDSMKQPSIEATQLLRQAYIDMRSTSSYYRSLEEESDAVLKAKVSKLIHFPRMSDPGVRGPVMKLYEKELEMLQRYSGVSVKTDKRNMLKLRLNSGNYATENGYSLVPPTDYLRIMSNVDDMGIRKSCYDQMMKNSYFIQRDDIAARIYQIRGEIASRLGYESHLDLILKTRFNEQITEEKLRSLLADDINHKNDWDNFYEIANAVRGIDSKIRIPARTVLPKLLNLCESVFDLSFKSEPTQFNGSVWRPNVELFSVWRDKQVAGYIYFDLYNADHKRRGNSSICINRRIDGDALEIPVVSIFCNFPNLREYRLSIFEVSSILHELGHTVHEMLGQGQPDTPQFNGTASIGRQHLETPSQLLEYWAWRPDILTYLSKDKLSPDLVEQVQITEQKLERIIDRQDIKRALLDIKVHSNPSSIGPADRGHSLLHHIITDGYDGGYFLYITSREKAKELANKLGSPLDPNKEGKAELQEFLKG